MDMRGKKFYISQLFSPWDPKKRDDTRVQLNPRTAVLQQDAKLRMQQLTRLVVVICIMVGVVTIKYIGQPQQIATQASFNFKRSLTGTIASIDTKEDAISVSYISSPDQKIIDAHKQSWTLHLVPGKSITTSTKTDNACYLANDLYGNLATATKADCRDVVVLGRKIIADYVVLNIPRHSMVVNTIIGLK